MDAAIAVGVAVVLAMRVAVPVEADAPDPDWRAYLLAVLFGVVLLWRRRHPAGTLVATLLLFMAYSSLGFGAIGAMWLLAPALFNAALYDRTRLAALVAGFQDRPMVAGGGVHGFRGNLGLAHNGLLGSSRSPCPTRNRPVRAVSRHHRVATRRKGEVMMKYASTLVAVALLLGACAQGGDLDRPEGEPVEDPLIRIASMDFQDGSVVVEAGTTVTWVWDDGSMQHNVISDDGLFESPLQAEGEWSHTFDEPGTFSYHCTPHPFMTGVIEVVDAER